MFTNIIIIVLKVPIFENEHINHMTTIRKINKCIVSHTHNLYRNSPAAFNVGLANV
jgi:hypothetical protein